MGGAGGACGSSGIGVFMCGGTSCSLSLDIGGGVRVAVGAETRILTSLEEVEVVREGMDVEGWVARERVWLLVI